MTEEEEGGGGGGGGGEGEEGYGPRYAKNMYRLTKYTENKLCNKLVFLCTIISRCTVNKTQNLVELCLPPPHQMLSFPRS